jgi:hypothetical protein
MSNDETAPVSGSRWEPATPPAGQPATTAYAPAPPQRNRGGLILAGGALGVALVAGAGGFALGHATADDGRDGMGRFGQGGPGGFQGQFPGGPGQQGGQQQGPQGTLPGQPPNGFPDPRDDDDDQGQADDGATQGSSVS